MADEFRTSGKEEREEQYRSLIPQIKALAQGEPDLIANLSNLTAALMAEFKFLWVGFYIQRGEDLVLGPFQGPVACARIQKGKGVCGTAFSKQETLLVPDVNAFSGHIACSPLSKSEIVVPIFDVQKDIRMVLDIDSEKPDHFDETDKKYLEKIADLVTGWL